MKKVLFIESMSHPCIDLIDKKLKEYFTDNHFKVYVLRRKRRGNIFQKLLWWFNILLKLFVINPNIVIIHYIAFAFPIKIYKIFFKFLKRDIKVIGFSHGSDVLIFPKKLGKITEEIFRSGINSLDVIFCPGMRIFKELLRYGYPESRIINVIYPFDFERFFKRVSCKEIEDKLESIKKPIYLFVGRPSKVKGWDRVLRFMEKHEGTLIVVGFSEKNVGKIPEKVRNKIIFFGKQPYEKMKCFYKAADYVLVLSRSEGGEPPFVVIEALLMKKKVILSHEISLSNVIGLIELGNFENYVMVHIKENKLEMLKRRLKIDYFHREITNVLDY